MPGEVFGEADIILRGRLDLLQQDLDQAEMLINQQSRRLEQQQQQTAESFRRTSDEGGIGFGTLLSAVTVIFGPIKTLTFLLTNVHKALKFIPVYAAAARVAMVGLVTGGVLLLAAAFNGLTDAIRNTRRQVGEVISAIGRLDGSTQKVRELADELSRLPIIGRLASNVYKVFSGDVGVAQEAVQSWVASVKDGQVELNFFGRTARNAVWVATLGFVDLGEQIDESNRKLREMEANMRIVASFNKLGASQGGQRFDREQGLDRSNELAGLDGVARIRAEQRHAHEDLMSFYDQQRREINIKQAEELAGIQKLRDEDEIGEREAQRQRDVVTQQTLIATRQLTQSRRRVESELTEQTKQRVDLFREEQRQIKEAESAESRRLEVMARSMQMRVSGDTLGAELVELEHRRQEAINQAVEQGHQKNLHAIRVYYDSRIEMAKAMHRRELRADREADDARVRSVAARDSRIESVRASTQADQLRMQGRDFDAQRVQARESVRQPIEDAIRTGDRELLAALQQQRTVRLAQIDQDERQKAMRDAEDAQRQRERELQGLQNATARQIDTSNYNFGGDGRDPKREEKDMLEQLKGIRQNTKQTAARAG